QQVEIDGLRQSQAQRRAGAGLVRGGKRLGGERALVRLAERGQHELAERGQMGERALAPKQVAAELFLQIADRTTERRLRDVALVGSLGEIECSRRRQEIADLVHFHAWSLPARSCSPSFPAARPPARRADTSAANPKFARFSRRARLRTSGSQTALES